MYKIVTLVGGIAFLGVAAILATALETGDLHPKNDSYMFRVFGPLIGFGLWFLGLGIKEIFFPGPERNEAVRHRREKERARGIVRDRSSDPGA